MAPAPGEDVGLERGRKTGQMESTWGGGQTAREHAAGPRADEMSMTEAGSRREPGPLSQATVQCQTRGVLGATSTSAQFHVSTVVSFASPVTSRQNPPGEESDEQTHSCSRWPRGERAAVAACRTRPACNQARCSSASPGPSYW